MQNFGGHPLSDFLLPRSQFVGSVLRFREGDSEHGFDGNSVRLEKCLGSGLVDLIDLGSLVSWELGFGEIAGS